MTVRKHIWPDHKKKLYAISIASLVISTVGLGIVSYINNNEPLVKAAGTTAHLQQVVKNMSDSLGETTPSGRVAHSYLSSLGAIKKDCQTITDSQAELSTGEAPKKTMALVNDTRDLCDDVMKLVDDSEHTYRAALPLLTINAQLKRYQTLPFVSNLVQNDHAGRITTALKKLSDKPSNNGDFPSDAKRLTEQLRTRQVSQSGFAYIPLLGSTQQQILAERQNYWTAYGSVHSLLRELDVQLDRYCHLPELENLRAVCKQPSD